MAFKFVVLFAFIAVTSAGFLPAAVKTSDQPVLAKAEDEYDPHPQYKFAYDVEDLISGDSKRQIEERDGDLVQGEYSLNDADGFRRTVQYSADPVNGFNAVVHREPLVKGVAAPAAVAAAPIAYAAPATNVVKTSAVAYSNRPALLQSVPVAYAAAAPTITVAHH